MAGFDPAGFWGLTPRLFAVHMRGALRRHQREAEARNRQAWHTAAMSGLAFVGKLPPYSRVFGPVAAAPTVRQPPDVLEVKLRALALMWGAAPLPGEAPQRADPAAQAD